MLKFRLNVVLFVKLRLSLIDLLIFIEWVEVIFYWIVILDLDCSLVIELLFGGLCIIVYINLLIGIVVYKVLFFVLNFFCGLEFNGISICVIVVCSDRLRLSFKGVSSRVIVIVIFCWYGFVRFGYFVVMIIWVVFWFVFFFVGKMSLLMLVVDILILKSYRGLFSRFGWYMLFFLFVIVCWMENFVFFVWFCVFGNFVYLNGVFVVFGVRLWSLNIFIFNDLLVATLIVSWLDEFSKCFFVNILEVKLFM